jgi:hypothetical protein
MPSPHRFAKGSFAIHEGPEDAIKASRDFKASWPCIILDGKHRAKTRLIYIFGVNCEAGEVPVGELKKVAKHEFIQIAAHFGYSLEALRDHVREWSFVKL